MERLTERTNDGILVKEDYGEDVLKTLYSCYDTEPMPHYENCEEGYCAIEKLAEYEDLEEQGKLLKLPCAVGDIIYQCMIVGIDDTKKPKYEVVKAKVFKFSLDLFTLCFWTQTADEEKHQSVMPLSAFGKTVFLTHEAAKVALEEIMNIRP